MTWRSFWGPTLFTCALPACSAGDAALLQRASDNAGSLGIGAAGLATGAGGSSNLGTGGASMIVIDAAAPSPEEGGLEGLCVYHGEGDSHPSRYLRHAGPIRIHAGWRPQLGVPLGPGHDCS